MLRKFGALLAAATFISTLAVTEAGAAQAAPADPGSCGVRVAGPIWSDNGNPTGANGFWAYIVRNRCGQTWSLTAMVAGRSTFCQDVYPGGSATYTSIVGDANWTVAVC